MSDSDIAAPNDYDRRALKEFGKPPKPVPLEPRAVHPDILKAIKAPRFAADSAQLLSDLIDVWGGTRKLALDLRNEFQHASKGGMTRQRILEMIQRLVVVNTTHEIGRSKSPSDMTDDELAAKLTAYAERLMAKKSEKPIVSSDDPGDDGP